MLILPLGETCASGLGVEKCAVMISCVTEYGNDISNDVGFIPNFHFIHQENRY